MAENVVFACSGTAEKPLHPITAETVAAVESAVRAKATTAVIAGATAANALLPVVPPEDSASIATLERTVGGRDLRVVVHCRYCGNDAIFTSDLVAQAKSADGTVAHVVLPPPSAGDLALIEAIKESTGSAGLKASYANAAFVLANLSLLTVLVTTLGLSKSEEIGSKMTGYVPSVCLTLALLAGAGAILSSLVAIRVSTGDVVVEDLESVRGFFNRQVKERAEWSRRSLQLLGVAMFALVIGFGFVIAVNHKSGMTTAGTLKVMIDQGRRDMGIETSWAGAPTDATALLVAKSKDKGPLLSQQIAVVDGAAETAVTLHLPAASNDRVLVTSTLITKNGTATGDSKRQCYDVPAVGPIVASNAACS